MNPFIKQALVVARRDFLAVVATPTFLLFLLAPLMMVLFGLIGGAGAAALSDNDNDERIVIIAPADEQALYTESDKALRQLLSKDNAPLPLTYMLPEVQPGVQATRVMADSKYQTYAVLYGDPARPVIIQRNEKGRSGAYLAQLAGDVHRALKFGAGKADYSSTPDFRIAKDAVSAALTRKVLASTSVILLFMLTLILASQSVGMLAEEKTNKVIEILAAAAPLESVFFGKLIGMLGVAILFIGFWALILGGGLFAGLSQLPDAQMAMLTEVQPAVGWPVFAVLFLTYFVLAFLLLGAIFLGIGAQAATMREIQMLSLPLTMVQFAMFGLASAAAAAPGKTVALIAQIIPFSSPLAMTAHAAHDATLWPHLLAIVWQIGWLALTVWLSVRLFRAGVLKAGGGWWSKRRGRKIALDAAD